jgi:predicted ABC-type ATPase
MEPLKNWNVLPKKRSPYGSTDSGQLRLRVFAGPNGSGKSTVIDYIRKERVNGRPLDFGYYINADEIAKQLSSGPFSFRKFDIKVTPKEFLTTAIASGLVNPDFDEPAFKASYTLRKNELRLKDPKHCERLAQITADFLRKKLLAERKKFSFETVFSHESKLEIMKAAKDAGYKVYLYFVSTESPAINKFRVQARKMKGGHDVPPDKIESRYYRSLELLHEASQLAYQAFFFDNSVEGKDSVLIAHFKLEKGKKKWDPIDPASVPEWFKEYYFSKA